MSKKLDIINIRYHRSSGQNVHKKILVVRPEGVDGIEFLSHDKTEVYDGVVEFE